MRDVALRWAWLAVLTLLLAACSSASATPTAASATPTPTATDTPTATPAGPTPTPTAAATAPATFTSTATPTPKPTPAPLPNPPAPTSFTAPDRGGGTVPCPSPNAAFNCRVTDLAWQSTAASGTWFKIYESWTLEGGQTCTDVQPSESVAIQTAPNARAAVLYTGPATGGGARCLWITAVNGAGESAQVAVAGQ
jgi:hypothetical protein